MGDTWDGNVVKYALDSNNNIVDKNGAAALDADGVFVEDAVPFWATEDWATSLLYSTRNIYTYLGSSLDLTASSNLFNTANMTVDDRLASPANGVSNTVDYIRGRDFFDDDGDYETNENRDVITGDVLHSEPAVYDFVHSSGALSLGSITGTFTNDEVLKGSLGGRAVADGGLSGSSLNYDSLLSPFEKDEVITGQTSGATATITAVPHSRMVYFGANDGMLHAVDDSDGSEAWAFIPPDPDLLSSLKNLMESSAHSYFVDSSPKLYLNDSNSNGFIDSGDQVILICGLRKGGSSYFALDVTNPDLPVFLWQISATGNFSDLGETWSVPTFGKVKVGSTETPVMFVGGGYSSDNSKGTAVYVVNVVTGDWVKTITDSTYMKSIPSQVAVVDSDNNGFVDKLYVGDLGGQVWRIGKPEGTFPVVDENIENWTAQRLFVGGSTHKIYYPPAVALEKGYDLVLFGMGDRENPCVNVATAADVVVAVKDDHSRTNLNSFGLSDLESGSTNGWYYALETYVYNADPTLSTGAEKLLSEGTIFNGAYYFTTEVSHFLKLVHKQRPAK